MKQIIYVDVLIAVNLFINYFILIAVTRFLYIKVGRLRILAGAFLGAIYSLYILLPELNIFISLVIKLIMSATIVWVAICEPKASMYLKCILCFYSMNFIFSGVIFAVWCMIAPRGLFMNNGIVYFNISPIVLIVATVISYIIIQFINKIVGKQKNKKTFCDVSIKIADKIINVKAKIDTGNALKEPFSGLPVLVVCEKATENVISKELLRVSCFEYAGENLSNTKDKLYNKMRLIPFSSVSGKGVLPAFKVDCVSISDVKREAYMAVCANDIMDEGFEALIGPDLVE